MEICIDFDGTCVTHEFPRIGKEIGAVQVLRELVENNHQLILFTMRSGNVLTEAVDWFKDNDIGLYGINENPIQKVWTMSPKAYGQLYIDDAALGIPLIQVSGERPHVDWVSVRAMLQDKGLLPAKEIDNAQYGAVREKSDGTE